jgi:hypothetical protein
MVSIRLLLFYMAGSLSLGLLAGAYAGIRLAVYEVMRRLYAKGYTHDQVMWFLQGLRGL